MERYQHFLDLNVNHSYFTDQRCKHLKFVPTENCAKVMNNAGLIHRSGQSGYSILADQNKLDVLMMFADDTDTPFELHFKAYNTDVNFINYTQPTIDYEKGIFYFRHVFSEQSQTRDIKIHQKEWVNESDIAPNNFLKERALLNSTDKLKPPCFVVSILITPQAIKDFSGTKYASPRFQIKFQAQANIWKYYLMSPESNSDVCIVDLDDKISFESMGVETIDSNKQAIIFQTKTVLNLLEKSNYHFQLKTKGENFNKVLINRLPVARVNQNYQAVIDGKMVSLSEIYINF